MLTKEKDITLAEKNESSANATEKTLNVIDCIFKHEALTFTEIKNLLNTPKATLHRILASLEQNDFIIRDEKTDKYSLGIKFIYYGEALKAKLTLVGIAESFVKDLARLTNESVYLSVQYDNYVICILSAEGEASALTSKLVPISSLNCSASGKLFLSSRSDDALADYFRGDLCAARTVNSICTLENFLDERTKILQQGLSFDNEEYEYGLYCITAPIYNHNNALIASIGVSGPLARMMMRDLTFIQNQLLSKSEELTDILTKIKYETEY